MRWFAMRAISTRAKSQNYTWAAFPSIPRPTWRCAIRKTCSPPCTWRGHLIVVQWLSFPGRSSSVRRPLPSTPGGTNPTASTSAAGQPRFRHLSPAEQQEWRRMGLCFNCDEPYFCGLVCQPAVAALGADPPEQPAASAEAIASCALTLEGKVRPMVSLHAIAGVQTDNVSSR